MLLGVAAHRDAPGLLVAGRRAVRRWRRASGATGRRAYAHDRACSRSRGALALSLSPPPAALAAASWSSSASEGGGPDTAVVRAAAPPDACCPSGRGADALPRCSHARHDATDPAAAPRAARTTSVVVGVIVGLLSLGLLALGGVLLWADSKKDEQGYISTDTQRFATRTSAIATDNLDVDNYGLGWLTSHDHYGNVRLEVSPRNDKPVFVGIARTKDVSTYLRGTSHATLTDFDSDPFRATYRAEPGAGRPAAPAGKRIWAASAHGTGTQTADLGRQARRLVGRGHERRRLARRRHRRQRRRRLPDPRRAGVGLGRRRPGAARRRRAADRRGHHVAAPLPRTRARARLRRCGRAARHPPRPARRRTRGGGSLPARPRRRAERRLDPAGDPRRRRCARLLRLAHRRGLRAVARRGAGALAGILVLDGDMVDQLYVEPGRTGRGIGSALLAVARRERPEGLRLWTFQSNAGAQRFYERHGFVAVRRTDGRGNEERAPDILYASRRALRRRRSGRSPRPPVLHAMGAGESSVDSSASRTRPCGRRRIWHSRRAR